MLSEKIAKLLTSKAISLKVISIMSMVLIIIKMKFIQVKIEFSVNFLLSLRGCFPFSSISFSYWLLTYSILILLHRCQKGTHEAEWNHCSRGSGSA